MCCGCDQKSNALTGGILGIIQSIIGIVMASVNIQKFNDDSDTLTQVVWDTKSYVKGFLVVFLLLQLAWLASSAILIFANMRGNICGIRQWLVTTSLVIIGEFLLPGIVVAITVYQLHKGAVEMKDRSIYNYFNRYGRIFIPGLFGSYISLILTFSKGGLVTIITNIVYCVFIGKRINALVSPSTGFVIGQPGVAPAVMVPLQNVQPRVQGQTVMQPSYVLQQPHAHQQVLFQGQPPQPLHFQGHALQPLHFQGHAFQPLLVQGQAYQPSHIQSQTQPISSFQGQPFQTQAHQQPDLQRLVTQPSGAADDFMDSPPQHSTADQTRETY